MARRINRTRKRHGLHRYRLDPELSRAATVHSKVMQRRRTVFHTSDLGNKVRNWSLLGEAVASRRTIKGTHRSLMRSAVHRALLMSGGFQHFGIGLVKKRGRRWATIIFSAGGNPRTTFKMPSC